jgi:hypothetical protein
LSRASWFPASKPNHVTLGGERKISTKRRRTSGKSGLKHFGKQAFTFGRISLTPEVDEWVYWQNKNREPADFRSSLVESVNNRLSFVHDGILSSATVLLTTYHFSLFSPLRSQTSEAPLDWPIFGSIIGSSLLVPDSQGTPITTRIGSLTVITVAAP